MARYTKFPNGINTGTVQLGSTTPLTGVIVSQVTLSPAVVAANTTAEQTFAVANVGSTDVVLSVNKPTAQAGLGIVGQRVASTGTIGITFSNNTAGTIVPTAAEVYDVITLSHG